MNRLALGCAIALLAACGPPQPPTVTLKLRVAGDERTDPFRNPGTAQRPASEVVLLTLTAWNAGSGAEHSVEVASDFGMSNRQVFGELPVVPGEGWQLAMTGKDTFGFVYALGRSRPFEVPKKGAVEVPLLLGIADDFAATGKVAGGLGPYASANVLPDGSVLLLGLGGLYLHEPTTGAVCASDCLSGERPSPRWLHAAVRLSDGRIFFAGGADATGATLDDAYLFDGATREFQRLKIPGLPARVGSAVALLGNGRVLLAGGRGAGADDGRRAVVVDPSAQLAAEAPQLPANAYLAAAASLASGEVLVCGGLSPTGEALAGAMVYAADGVTARRAPDLGTARGAHSATLMKDKHVFIYGGVGPGGWTIAKPEQFVAGDGTVLDYIGVIEPGPSDVLTPHAGHVARLLGTGEAMIVGGEDLPTGAPDPGRADPALRFRPEGEVGGVYRGIFEHVGMVGARAGATAVVLPDQSLFVAGGVRAQLAPNFKLPLAADWTERLEVFVPCAVQDRACPR